MSDPYAQHDATINALRRESRERVESMPDVDAPPTGMTSGSSEEDRIRAQQSKAAAAASAAASSVPQRVFCAHVQPCKACNPTVAIEERAASTVEPAATSTVESTPRAKPAQRASSTVGASQRASIDISQTFGKPSVAIHPVQALLVVLTACKTDAERTALLDAAPEDVRRQLIARLRYDAFITDTAGEVEALDHDLATFTQTLDDAPDDAARLALIRTATPSFLGEWRRHSTATQNDYRVRYMRLAGIGT